jgi:hypothetical protein
VKAPKKPDKKAKKPAVLSGPDSTRESINIRKIANGYIVRRSTYDDKGPGMESEHYVAERPKIDVPKAKGEK